MNKIKRILPNEWLAGNQAIKLGDTLYVSNKHIHILEQLVSNGDFRTLASIIGNLQVFICDPFIIDPSQLTDIEL